MPIIAKDTRGEVIRERFPRDVTGVNLDDLVNNLLGQLIPEGQLRPTNEQLNTPLARAIGQLEAWQHAGTWLYFRDESEFAALNAGRIEPEGPLIAALQPHEQARRRRMIWDPKERITFTATSNRMSAVPDCEIVYRNEGEAPLEADVLQDSRTLRTLVDNWKFLHVRTEDRPSAETVQVIMDDPDPAFAPALTDQGTFIIVTDDKGISNLDVLDDVVEALNHLHSSGKVGKDRGPRGSIWWYLAD